MRSRSKKERYLIWIFTYTLFLLPVLSWAGVPVVSEEMVTDVTTRSFSVIWKANEASTADLDVFDGPACITPTVGAVITPHPVLSGDAAIRTAAEDSGVMKVMVTGLLRDTEYCYQTRTTSKSTSATTVEPASPGHVFTEVQTLRTFTDPATGNIFPFSNDLMVFPVNAPDGLTPSLGSLLVGEVTFRLTDGTKATSGKVTAFVGDGIPSPNAMIDLNNVFDRGTGETLDLFGGEVMALREFRGDGSGVGPGSATLVRIRETPVDNELSEVKDPLRCFFVDNDCDMEVTILDVQRGLNLFGAVIGDNVFNDDMDVVSLGEIDILDIQSVLNRFGETKPFTP